MNIFKGKKSENGQTLILSALSMLILLLAVVLMFDLQRLITMKFKGQTGVDAAALVGAGWQKDSLNLIGELNLVKACTVLLSDVPPVVNDQANFLKVQNLGNPDWVKLAQDSAILYKKSDLLTEMQARISFVGPMLGFGALQQAAKNNGINYNSDYCKRGLKNLNMLENDDSVYGSTYASQYVPVMTDAQITAGREAYAWRAPYVNMLKDVLMTDGIVKPKGLAVWVAADLAGTPRLTSTSPEFLSYLMQKGMYTAINANYWCDLIGVLEMDFGAPGSKWWGDITAVEESTSFGYESEYLSLGIDFLTGRSAYNSANSVGGSGASAMTNMVTDRKYTLLRSSYDNQDPYTVAADGTLSVNPDDTDQKYDPLIRINWAIYDTNKWYNYSEDFNDTWKVYLTGAIKSEYLYKGANVKISAFIPASVLFGSWQKISELADQKSRADLSGKSFGAPIYFGNNQGIGKDIKKYSSNMSTVGDALQSSYSENSNSTNSHSISTSLAKPFGRIKLSTGSYVTPNSTSMILPVFERVALIPIQLEYSNDDDIDPSWYFFVTEYLPTLGTVNSLDEMPAAIAEKYPGDWGYFVSYHAALVKLNTASWRQTGIDWLNYDNGDKPIYDSENPTKIIGYTPHDYNKDRCTVWVSGGSGTRSGPSITH